MNVLFLPFLAVQWSAILISRYVMFTVNRVFVSHRYRHNRRIGLMKQ